MTERDEDYDLEVLLELRERERDEAEQQYREALEQHENLDEKVEALEAEHRQMVQERKQVRRQFDDELAEGGQTLGRIRKFDRYVSELRQREEEMLVRIEKVRRRRRRARRDVERTHDQLLAAIRELEAVRTHREDWRECKEMADRRRRHQKMDELAARIWREN